MKSSDYRQLKVWQMAMELTVEIYNIVKLLPREETYALSDQMRRAVVSIPSNAGDTDRNLHSSELHRLYNSG